MIDVDELGYLREVLAEAAEQGQGAQLSADMTRLLMLVIEAQRGLFVDSARETGGHRVRPVMGNDDGEEPSIILGETSEIMSARAIFATAPERNMHRRFDFMANRSSSKKRSSRGRRLRGAEFR
jgi:hypothetical protein